jgi:PAS domain S-box-containing protein
MEMSMDSQLMEVLEARRDTIVDSWYRAIGRSSYVPLSAEQVRQHLRGLMDQVISFLCAERVEEAKAQEIGASLPRLHYVQPRTLGRTLGVLVRHLVEELPAEQAAALQPRLAVLFEGLATGFGQQARATTLAQQEEIRSALVEDIRSAERALRRAHDELELRVERRTKDLARANEELVNEIAERKRVEAALRESEEKFRGLAEQSPNMIFISRMGTVVYANRRAEELLGYERAEYYADGFQFLTLVAPESRREVLSNYAMHLEGQQIEPYEHTLVTRDGRRIEAIIATRLIDYEGVRALLGIVTDITEYKRAARALRRSEAQYRTVLDSMGDAIHVVDADLRVVLANRALKRWIVELGLDTDVVGKTVFEAFPFLPPSIRGEYEEVLEAGQLLITEESLLLDEGDLVTETRKIPVVDGGQVVQVVTVVRNVTERRRAESQRDATVEALRVSEGRYRMLLESMRDGVYTVDCQGRFTFVNGVIVQRSGRSAEWFLERACFDTVRPEDRETVRENLDAVLRGEQVPIFEVAYPTASGDLMWLELNTAPLLDDGVVVGLHGVSRDITGRRQMEAALRESKQQWRSLVENAPDTVLTVDREGRILFMNRPILAQSAAEASGKNILDALAPEDRKVVAASIRRVFETGSPDYHEVTAPDPGGARVWYGTRAGPVWDGDEVVAVMMVTRDISEQKRLEEMKDNLIRDVSHELRTPLAKMQMGLELLMELMDKESIDRQRVARIGEVTSSNVRRLLGTVEGILDLSALEAGRAAYQMETIGTAELIDEVVLDMRPLAEAKGVELAIDLPEDPALVEGDWQKLFRVVANLVDNAIKFSDDGRIVLSVRQNQEELEISISDSGCGILPENLERVFERFYQEKARVAGVGVGLTISKAIVEAHGGRIWAESAGRGLGSTIHIALPAADA